MPTLSGIAERLALAYTLARDGAPESDVLLDRLFDAVADLDVLAGGLTSPAVRAVLDPSDALYAVTVAARDAR